MPPAQARAMRHGRTAAATHACLSALGLVACDGSSGSRVWEVKVMWEGIQAMFALTLIVVVTLVAVIMLEELTALPDIIRQSIRGRAQRRSLAARVEELEARMAAAERKLGRPAA
jgi:hypothetical protein